jgi:hypothetical protein
MLPFSADSTVGLAYRHVHEEPGQRPRRPALRRGRGRAALLATLAQRSRPCSRPPPMGRPRPGRPRRWRASRTEMVLGSALAAALAALAVVLVTRAAGHGVPAAAPTTARAPTHGCGQGKPERALG